VGGFPFSEPMTLVEVGAFWFLQFTQEQGLHSGACFLNMGCKRKKTVIPIHQAGKRHWENEIFSTKTRTFEKRPPFFLVKVNCLWTPKPLKMLGPQNMGRNHQKMEVVGSHGASF